VGSAVTTIYTRSYMNGDFETPVNRDALLLLFSICADRTSLPRTADRVLTVWR